MVSKRMFLIPFWLERVSDALHYFTNLVRGGGVDVENSVNLSRFLTVFDCYLR
jgi:hypothetical protein